MTTMGILKNIENRLYTSAKSVNLNFYLTVLITVSTLGLPVFAQSDVFKNGLVVSAHPEASKVGIDILKQGGNAVDAAVAVQFALAVVYPNAGNLGGGGFMVYRSKSGEIASIDFREKAPAKASRDMFLDGSGNPIVDKSLYGQLASGVPGSVDGMVQAHKKYGTLDWKTVLQPAVDLAKKGFNITKRQASELNQYKASFEKYNALGTALIKKGSLWKERDILIQDELAHTLELIRDKGRNGFYDGEVARYIVEEMQRGGGLISYEDLKNYKAVWRKPLTGTYKGYKVITMPPTSSGGVALLQLLKSVESYPLSRWGHNTDSTVQLIVEAERRVYADRATHLGDPDFYKVPISQLLADSYQKSRMSNFNWNKATLSSEISAGTVIKESDQTTHFSIVDKEGNAVSLTTTLNDSYGSKVVVKGAGFLLNDEMDDFSAKPGYPNMYGLVGGEANAIVPNKRMLSSMTPTILEKDGQLFMVVGTPGGSTIITSVFQIILNVVEFGMGIQEAVDVKRFHHQWLPDEIVMEKEALGAPVVEKLQAKGYKIKQRAPIGRVDAILRKGNGYVGGADPRGDDTKMGY